MLALFSHYLALWPMAEFSSTMWLVRQKAHKPWMITGTVEICTTQVHLVVCSFLLDAAPALWRHPTLLGPLLKHKYGSSDPLRQVGCSLNSSWVMISRRNVCMLDCHLSIYPHILYLFPSFTSEPPALSQITGSPLDDKNLDVRWRSRVDLSVTGFVLEWFAVRENNNSILYWEKLNSSCTALVITGKINDKYRWLKLCKI